MDKEKLIGVEQFDYLPMLRPLTEELLKSVLIKQKPKKILEIGTFLGYSAAVMLETVKEAHITTIEKSEQNACYAKENLEKFGERVDVICCDAINFLETAYKSEKFDLIFLDGPKGQYLTYYPYLKQMLEVGGVLICDDVLFHGMVKKEEKIEHKHRSLVVNLRKFLELLLKDEDFATTLYEFEDGVTISILK